MRASLAVLTAVLVASPTGRSRAQAAGAPSQSAAQSLEAFLRRQLAEPNTDPDSTTRFIAAVLPVRGQQPDYVVYVSGRTWCGTGGCLLLVLEPTASTYRVIGQTTIARLPIRVLRTTHHGHPDLSVWVAGGGVRPPYVALLTYDGARYPLDPTMPPARRAPVLMGGRILIRGESEGERLYPRAANSPPVPQAAETRSNGVRVVLPDSEVAYAPDSELVVSPRRTTPLVPGRPADEDDDPRELWIARPDGTGARRLLAARPDTNQKHRLARFMTPAFSPDGRRIFFLSMAWATSHALHVYDLTTDREHFVRPAADFVVIPRGRFAGCLLVSDHTWNPRTNSYYYPRRVVTPDSGVEIAWVDDRGDDDPKDPAFVTWWRKNVPAVADVPVPHRGQRGMTHDPRCSA